MKGSRRFFDDVSAKACYALTKLCVGPTVGRRRRLKGDNRLEDDSSEDRDARGSSNPRAHNVGLWRRRGADCSYAEQLDSGLHSFYSGRRLQERQVGSVWTNGQPFTTNLFRDLEAAITSSGAEKHAGTPGATFTVGGVLFTVLAPASLASNVNDNSLVVRMDCGESSFLFTGDAETSSENEMIVLGKNLDVDVLKLGHHGSRTSTSSQMILATTPMLAIYQARDANATLRASFDNTMPSSCAPGCFAMSLWIQLSLSSASCPRPVVKTRISLSKNVGSPPI